MNKIEITDQQAENTKMAYAIMAGIPNERINLDFVRYNCDDDTENISDKKLFKTCGAVACIAGWLSAHPYFKKQGLKFNNSNTVVGFVDFTLAETLFGADYIFDSSEFMEGEDAYLTQKSEALRRLRKHLLSAGRITKARNKELKSIEKFEAKIKTK